MKPPSSVAAHHSLVRALPCAVTGKRLKRGMSLHHVHGGSIKDLGWHVGMGQRQNEALVIPLVPELHYIGPNAIDGGMGVETWEFSFGTQEEHIDWVGEQLGYSLWELAESWRA